MEINRFARLTFLKRASPKQQRTLFFFILGRRLGASL